MILCTKNLNYCDIQINQRSNWVWKKIIFAKEIAITLIWLRHISVVRGLWSDSRKEPIQTLWIHLKSHNTDLGEFEEPRISMWAKNVWKSYEEISRNDLESQTLDLERHYIDLRKISCLQKFLNPWNHYFSKKIFWHLYKVEWCHFSQISAASTFTICSSK